MTRLPLPEDTEMPPHYVAHPAVARATIETARAVRAALANIFGPTVDVVVLGRHDGDDTVYPVARLCAGARAPRLGACVFTAQIRVLATCLDADEHAPTIPQPRRAMPMKKAPAKRTATKRTKLVNASGSHYVRRRKDGTFKTVVSVGKSLAADRRTKAKTKVKSGQGDKGDR